jgi:hypothetical protein
MTSIERIAKTTTAPANKGFLQIAETFISKGWSIKTNTSNMISFARPDDPRLVYDEFKIIAETDKINVLIPMPNSNVAYCTWFKDYFSASEYMTNRLEDYSNALSLTELPNEPEHEDD